MNPATTNGSKPKAWNDMTEAEAIRELCKRCGVLLRVTPDGTLKASGNTKGAHGYFEDIAAMYRGTIIAHLRGQPVPEISDDEDRANLRQLVQALDKAIADYCEASGKTAAYLDELFNVRRRMCPALLLQNLCAFRAWLYEVRNN